ncbi:MAG: peptidylprolyl isomerase [Patescibacteria group bacterium]
MKKYIVLGIIPLVIILVTAALLLKGGKKENNMPSFDSLKLKTTGSQEAKPQLNLALYNTPIMIIDQNKKYTAKFKTTAGDFEIELNAKDTPITANNFVFLAKKKFYDGTPFHRVINGFMIQGGDPRGDGTGGPGYTFQDEPFDGEYTRGTVAMANAGSNTNGSQFFVMHQDYSLPKNYVIFGKVVSGMDTIDAIAEGDVIQNEDENIENSKPENPIVVESVEIVEN